MPIHVHPNENLRPEWVNILRDNAEAAEKLGSLNEPQLTLVHEQQWFKILIPQVYGGLELDLPQALKLEEALSWADGSIGWTVTLCAGAGWFAGFLDESMANAIFHTDQVCLGGSGAPTGFAQKTADGYRIDGHWRFATGAAHLSHFTTNCIIKDGDEILLNPDGNPLIRSFVFPKDAVKLLDDWKTLGLVATGSHAFEIKQLDVSTSNTFQINPLATVIDRPLYKYPFMQLAETTLAANISGMAIHFLDLCADIFKDRISRKNLSTENQQLLNTLLQEQTLKLDENRQQFYAAAEESWASIADQGIVPADQISAVSSSSRRLAKVSRESVDILYPFCGLIAADPSSEVNRVWRDLHTASQHSLLNLA